MKIAVDIDDTLSIVPRARFIRAYLRRTGLPFRIINPAAGKVSEVCNWAQEDAVRFMREGGTRAFEEARLRRGAKETLAGWLKAGHEIVVLTARTALWFSDPLAISRGWLEKNGVPYTRLVTDVEEKGAYCKEHGIGVLVDDRVENCLAAEACGVPAVLAVRGHNAARSGEVPLSGRSWKEIARAVRTLTGEEA